MGEMSKIEEGAQRMAAKELDDGDGLYDWYALTDSVADKYRALMREAIEALRDANLIYAVLEPRTEADEIAGRREFYGDSGAWLSLWNSAIDAALKE